MDASGSVMGAGGSGMKVSLIVAMAKNHVIGRDNQLPWHLPEDLRYFKRVTMGKPVIMGRKTFESIGRPLPGRANIVITRNTEWQAEGVHVVHSLDAAIDHCRKLCAADGIEEAMVIGGAEIYSQALHRADRLYLTWVHAHVEGDAWFPDFPREEWQEIAVEDFHAEGNNPYDYSFVVLERTHPPA